MQPHDLPTLARWAAGIGMGARQEKCHNADTGLPTLVRILSRLSSGNRQSRRPAAPQLGGLDDTFGGHSQPGSWSAALLVCIRTNIDYNSDYGYAGIHPSPDIRGQDASV